MASRLVCTRYLWRPQLLTRAAASSEWGPFLVPSVRRSALCASGVCVQHRVTWVISQVVSGALSAGGGALCHCT